MNGRLPTPTASGPGYFRKLTQAVRQPAGLLAAVAGLLLSPYAQAQAPVVYGLGTATATIPSNGVVAGQQGLVTINLTTGAPISPTNTTLKFPTGIPVFPFIDVPAPLTITGVTAGQSLIGIDFRAANGLLYALGYDAAPAAPSSNAQLYTISTTTGVAMAVGNALRLDLGATDRIGFDFNPQADRIRVVSAVNQHNYRLNPDTGALVQQDTDLSYAPGALNIGQTPGIGAIAYTRSFAGSTSTMLYDFDEFNNGLFSVQASPNDGVLTIQNRARFVITQGSSPGTYSAGSPKAIDLDIYANPSTGTDQAYLVEVTQPNATTQRTSSNFYTFDLATGTATQVGNTIPSVVPFEIRDIAAGIAPATSPLTWDGSESTAWSNPLNWTPAFLPTATTDVIIPGDTPPNDPTVTGSQLARSVTLTTGAVLTTADASTLSVFGDFVNNGGSVAGAGSGVIALTGPANQSVGGSSPTTFFNLSVGANGATLTGTAAVQRLLTLTGDLTTSSQSFTLLSNASGQGQVINAGGIVAGNATVQRAIDGSLNPQNIGYRHYASPVAGASVSDLNSSTGSGFSAVLTQGYNSSAKPRSTKPFPNVFGYDQNLIAGSIATDAKFNFDKGFFVPIDAFESGNLRAGLQPGHGYTVNIGDNVTVDFVGALNNGPVSVTGLSRSADDQAGYQFLGNPYPSSLDWNMVSRSADIEPALYVFKSTGQYTGFYSSYNNGASTNGGTNVLPVAQGFFVQAAPGATNASVSFGNGARLTSYDNTPFQRGAADARPELTLALRTATGWGEQTVIYFEQGATAAYDARYDANHLAGPGAPLSLATAGNLSINGRSVLSGADVVVPLELSANEGGTYRLQVDALKNLPAGYHAYLRDALTGTSTELSAESSLPLTLAASVPATGRYAVVFSTQAQVLASAPAALAQLAGVYPNPAHGTASLLLPAALRGGKATPVQLVNSLGQVVRSRTLPAGANTTLELPLTNLAPGVYTVRAQTAVGQIAKRLTVE